MAPCHQRQAKQVEHCDHTTNTLTLGILSLCGKISFSQLALQIAVVYTDAILGSVCIVDTGLGPKRLVIPAGTQHGTRLLATSISGPSESRSLTSPIAEALHVFEVVLRLPRVLSDVERHLLSRLALEGSRNATS